MIEDTPNKLHKNEIAIKLRIINFRPLKEPTKCVEHNKYFVCEIMQKK